jgi:carboxypeptidase Taq
MAEPLRHLKETLASIEDLKNAAEVLSWDQETFMPDGGAEARARQIATLRTMAHERFVTDEMGALLDRADDALNGANATAEALVRVTRRDYTRARKIPSTLVTQLSEASSRAQVAWQKARAADDFDAFAPHLQRLVDLNIEKAEALGYEDEPYDALLDEYEPGLKTADVASVFDALRKDLVPIVDVLADQPLPDDDFMRHGFAPDAQQAFGEQIIDDFGYDFERGRQDRSAHPFTTSFSINDVRLTTRFDEHFLPSGLFSTLHEAGHGLYEQGIDPALERTPLAEGTSLGMHESQSRLWENLVGRSHPFWSHYFPALQDAFPKAFADVSLEAFYRAINRVEPSLIRVESDEVTYNLHIMLRFELERGLVQGTVSVDELPDRWRSTMDAYLGVQPSTDAEGVLQDVHWSMGAIGYFPTYALGNLMSVQLFDQVREEISSLDTQIASGEFAPLLGWLREHIHRPGRMIQASDLLERVTGKALDAAPWLRYIRAKYGALYNVPLP